MTATSRASSTIVWLKQLTTSGFSSMRMRINRIDFLRRNRKAIALLLVFWCFLVTGSYFLCRMAGERQRSHFLHINATIAENLAAQSAPRLLENDVLGLTREVAENAKAHNMLYAAILNHENRVMAHSDAENFNKPYQPLESQEALVSVNGVMVHHGWMPDGTHAIAFMQKITFAGVRIGSAVNAVPYERLGVVQTRIMLIQFALVLFWTVSLAIIALVRDKGRKRQTLRQLQISENGKQIGPYRLKEKIAQGGMAQVYLAEYERGDGFRRKVAIKMVLPHLAENQEFIDMFIREARLAALLQHPNIVQIFDFGKIQNTYLIAMEYIHGMNLGQIITRVQSPLPADVAVFIIQRVSLGLDYSHKLKDDETGQTLGIIHRDISPQNIMISHQGGVKISDFGISKATTEPSLTKAGVIKGKLAYLAPEQALGQPVDHRADIYALGLVFYEMLSGKRLYQFDSDIEAIRSIPKMIIPPLPSVRPELPEALSRIVMKCLEKDKNARYADAEALYNDLMQLKSTLPYDTSDLVQFMRKTMNP